jgi:hypothetical protein
MFYWPRKQADNVIMREAIQSHSLSTLVDLLSRGSHLLCAARVLGDTDITRDFGIIMQALSQSTWIRVADFTGVCLGSVDKDRGDNARASFEVRQLAKTLRSSQLIAEIRLVGADLNEADVQELEAALKANKSVKTFSVESGPKAETPVPIIAPITHLANVLRTNASISELRLDGSDLSPAEVEELVAALKRNSCINSLRLHKFDLSGRAGEALVDLVHQLDVDSGSRRHASVIETLAVTVSDDCDVEHFWSPALCAALKSNATLTSIDLGTCFDSSASAALIDALEHNPRIFSVRIDADVFEDSQKIASSIDQILRARFLASRASADDPNSR